MPLDASKSSDPRARALASVFEAMAEGVVVHAPDGAILLSNPAAERILGLTDAQLRGRDSLDPRWRCVDLHGDPFPGERHPAMVTLETGEAVSDVVMGVHTPSGELRWIRVSSRPVHDPDTGELNIVVASFLDLTAEREAIEATRAAEQEVVRQAAATRTLLETVSEAIITMGPRGRILSFNRAAERMFGWTEDEILGREVQLLMPEPHRSLHHDYVRHHLDTGRTHVLGSSRRVRALRRDGTTFPVRLSVSRADVDGEPLFFGVLTDLQLEAELEARLRTHQKMEAVGTFAGGIAHDFNNILHGAVLALRQLRRPSDDDGQLAAIESMLGRGTDLVRQLLTFARADPESGPRETSVGEAVEQLMDLLRSAVPRRIDIVAPPTRVDACVALNTTQLHQVLMNLVLNAAQAMEGRTGTVGITLHLARLERPRQPLVAGDYVVIRVADDGVGIAPEDLHRLFEPFFTTRGHTGGTGLGLAVVHGIVAGARGHVEVESTVGRGTTFAVWLPVVADHQPHREAPRRQEGVPAGLRVLFIDDQPMLAGLGARLVGTLGGIAQPVTDPYEGLRLVLDDPASIDVVVTDLHMPGLSGLEVAARLAAELPDLPVVITSGYYIDEALPPNVVAVLDKPFSPEELAEVLILAGR